MPGPRPLRLWKTPLALSLSAILLGLALSTRAGETSSGPQQEESSMKDTIAEKLFHQTPQQIRRDLQQKKTGDLCRRRLIIGLSLAGIVAMTIVSLYQTGLIQQIPDLPNRAIFAARKVNSSDQAYKC